MCFDLDPGWIIRTAGINLSGEDLYTAFQFATQLVDEYSPHCLTGIAVGLATGMLLKCLEQQFRRHNGDDDDDDDVDALLQQPQKALPEYASAAEAGSESKQKDHKGRSTSGVEAAGHSAVPDALHNHNHVQDYAIANVAAAKARSRRWIQRKRRLKRLRQSKHLTVGSILMWYVFALCYWYQSRTTQLPIEFVQTGRGTAGLQQQPNPCHVTKQCGTQCTCLLVV